MASLTAETRPTAAATGPVVKRRRLDRSQVRAGWLLLAPALIHSVIFIVVPTAAAIVLAFTDYSFGETWSWIGFDNFRQLFIDEDFRASLINTIVYSVVVVPLAMVLALIVAVALNQQIRGLSIFRTAFYIPTVTATVAVATIWMWIFNPGSGLANGILSFFGLAPAQWLSGPSTALPSLMVIGIWQGIGAKMIIYLAALQGVPKDLMEAASLDGASRWQRFRNVTWPSLAPVQFFVIITSIVETFQVFDLVYVTTQGGPGTATKVLVFDIYTKAFQSLRLGLASAETVIMMILIGAFIMIGRLSQRNT